MATNKRAGQVSIQAHGLHIHTIPVGCTQGKAEAARKRRRDANGSFAKAEPSRAESHGYGFDSEQECPVHDHSNLHAMFDLGDPA